MDYTRMTLGRLLGLKDETLKRNAMSILKRLQKIEYVEEQEYFEITSVARADLEGIGYDTSEVDDSTMYRLASKMADAYCDQVFWIDLPIIADYLEIPTKEDCLHNYDDDICKTCGHVRD